MRKKYTFLLTILPTEDDDEALRGRLQLVQSNQADTFTNLDELRKLIQQVLNTNSSELYGLNGKGLAADAASEGL
jgi:hypothetical protein